MKAKSLLIGFLTGTVVAGAATLLSTPSSGKDLRNRIKTNTEEIKNTIDELKVKMLNIKDDTMEASQISKETVKTFISDVQVVIESWKREIEPNKMNY